MKLIKPGFVIEDEVDGMEILRKIERAGRTCYKSEARMTDDSCRAFVKKVLDNGHHSVLEHEKVTVRVICDRGVTHEIVRHRIASYSQESTRYCDYGSGHVVFIIPPWVDVKPGNYMFSSIPEGMSRADGAWFRSMLRAEEMYKELREQDWVPQQARSVLPNSLKTEIVMTMNLREWRHFFRLRAANKRAHPQMREVAIPMLEEFKRLIPIVFDDLKVDEVSE